MRAGSLGAGTTPAALEGEANARSADHSGSVAMTRERLDSRGNGAQMRQLRTDVRPRDTLRVLHVGCGSHSPSRLHGIFKGPQWQEIRLDIESVGCPDITTSIANMQPFVDSESCEAIWASHVLEHLCRHEVPRALSEFRRVLAPTGFALIRCPDLEVVAQFIIDGRIDDVIYTSPAGPITPLDMLYGHSTSIASGDHAMRHGTGFTQDLLAKKLLAARFPEVRTTRTANLEVWAAAFMPDADSDRLLRELARLGLDLRG